MSMLLVVVNLYLLNTFEQRWLPAIIALTLIFSTLLPMGAYPWLVAEIVEEFDWFVSECCLGLVVLFSSSNDRCIQTSGD